MKTFQILENPTSQALLVPRTSMKDTQSRLSQEEAQPGGTADQDQALIRDSRSMATFKLDNTLEAAYQLQLPCWLGFAC